MSKARQLEPRYAQRLPREGVLSQVLTEHLETFLARTAAGGEGRGLPAFVERELRSYLTCGLLCHGFARIFCDSCGRDLLVPFSCKGRGFGVERLSRGTRSGIGLVRP